MSENYYDILGVPKTASDDEIKKAFRKLAVETHPDKHPGDKAAEERFKKINEAYSTLSDKDKKQAYDAQQSNPFANGQTFTNGGNPFGEGFTSNFGFGGADMAEDILRNFFNQRASSHFNERRSSSFEEENLNLRVKLNITFEEAYTGTTKTISYNATEKCEECNGEGYDKHSKFIRCPECSGQGYTVAYEETFFGQRERKKVKCKACNGTGNRHEKQCTSCKGSGVKMKLKTIKTNIPAGAYDGMEMRAAKNGNTSKAGRTGDLYIVVGVPSISSDGKLKRTSGQTIETNMTVSYYELLTGAERSIKLPDGTEKRFRIPANMSLKSQLKLNGCGFKMVNDQQHGDLIVNLNLEQLSNLTPKQKELLKKFDESIKR